MKTSPISLAQKMVGDVVCIGQSIPYIHGIIDLDITEVRQKLRKLRQESGSIISLNTLLLKACVLTLQDDLKLTRMFAGHNKVVTPERINVFFPIESEGGELNTLLIKNVASKSLMELQTKVSSKDVITLDKNQRIFMQLPWVLRRLFYTYWLGKPVKRHAYFGNVYFSSVSNMSNGSAMAGIPIPMHPIGLFLGSVYKHNGQDMIKLTVSIDHRINNGADIARFVTRLNRVLTSDELYTHA